MMGSQTRSTVTRRSSNWATVNAGSSDWVNNSWDIFIYNPYYGTKLIKWGGTLSIILQKTIGNTTVLYPFISTNNKPVGRSHCSKNFQHPPHILEPFVCQRTQYEQIYHQAKLPGQDKKNKINIKHQTQNKCQKLQCKTCMRYLVRVVRRVWIADSRCSLSLRRRAIGSHLDCKNKKYITSL